MRFVHLLTEKKIPRISVEVVEPANMRKDHAN